MSRFAILLPVKIEGNELTKAQSDSLRALHKSCVSSKISYAIFLGIDEDKEGCDAVKVIKNIFGADKTIVKTFPEKHKGAICKYWKALAKAAFEDGYDFFCLLGDDVEMHSQAWMDKLVEDFQTLQDERGLPFGFGCVAIKDEQAPGFPTFPVLHRSHIDLMDGEMFSDVFVNQDADPFLFQLYRRFGASVFSKSVSLTNRVGGVQLAGDKSYQVPRYDRKHVDWSGDLLTEAVTRIETNLRSEKQKLPEPRWTTVDVVVPTYRVKEEFLTRICELKCRESHVDLNFIVIVDNPDADVSFLNDLVKQRTDLRVRVNSENRGASFTRNVGIKESAAEWILFLDDDVIPDPSIVDEYVKAVRSEGSRYDGFVGYSELPNRPHGVFPTAVHLSCVSFFWRAAREMQEMPWGITANLLVRRSACRPFDLAYIKTGGGEDIDFCLQLRKWPLRAVPAARVEHPWWDDGARCYKHFFNWSFSDGILQDRYPYLTYRCLPDAVEFSLLAAPLAGWLRRSWAVALAVPAAVLLADTCMDFAHLWRDHKAEPYSKGIVRVLAVLESSLIKNTACLGHVWGHVQRGHVFNLCQRFDWFCGLNASVVAEERRKALNYFATYMVAAVGATAALASRRFPFSRFF